MLSIKNKRINFFPYKKEHWVDIFVKNPHFMLPMAFFLLLSLGTILLLLPFSTKGNVSFIDTLFVSTSASCVTGLTTLNIGDSFSNFGLFLILLLIQTGGLGIMSITSIIYILLGKRMSLSQEKSARSMFDVESKDEVKDSLKLIFKYTFSVEFIGAVILFTGFLLSDLNIITSLKYAIFLTISAFCNAGFFLIDSSLLMFNTNPIILFTTSILVILGGLSPVIAILILKFFKREKLKPMPKIVFATTFYLLIFGTILFFIFEFNGVLNNFGLFDKISNAFFEISSLRTSGFTSLDINAFHINSYVLVMFLMFIGGSPGGTAGGIKTTTFAVIVLAVINTFLKRENIVSNKKITEKTTYNAITLIVAYIIIALIVLAILTLTQPLSPFKLLFETISALGTTGISVDTTRYLNIIGKIAIIVTMFIGRVGPSVLIWFLNDDKMDVDISYPDAKISLS